MYNFDKEIDRSQSNCIKHKNLLPVFGRKDLLPLWIADMDFETPPFILDALRERLAHPVLGYTALPDDYWKVVAAWVKQQHTWDISEDWCTFIPGIVRGIGLVINFFTQPGDKIIIQPPVYPPFYHVAKNNEREVVLNPLRETANGSYEMDFEQLEALVDSRCKLLILANPHNPGGVVWAKETLQRLARICKEHQILVISDEIHADLTLFGYRHIPFASVSEEAAEISITFQAPSKTFNMAGLASSYAIVPHEALRKPFYHWLTTNEFNVPHMLAPIATIAAYQQGEAWRREVVQYLEANVCFVEDYLAKHLPEFKVWRPMASFILWLDCRALQLNQEQLHEAFVNHGLLALNEGHTFGPGGEGFMRLNIGVPRHILQRALERFEAVKAYAKNVCSK